MPLTDKEIALQFLDHIEDFLIQTGLLQSILSQHVPNWKKEYHDLFARGQQGARKVAHQQLEPFRDLVLQAPHLSSAGEQILKRLPKNDPE